MMSKDLFNKINFLKSSPSTEKTLYTGTARTAVADLFTAVKPNFTWSQSLSQAALHYINLVGTNRGGNESDILMTARNRYAHSICNPLYGTFTHTRNSAGTWNSLATYQEWFTSNSSFFSNAKILNGSYTHLGIACSCHYTATVICGFVFTDCYVGNEITSDIPQFLDYTAPGSCPAVLNST